MCWGYRYSASSPDEQALVSASKFFGFTFESRGLGIARIRITNKALLRNAHDSESELWEYKVLDVLEFNSDRKRMSCVVQDPQDRYLLLTKVCILPRHHYYHYDDGIAVSHLCREKGVR